VTHTQRNSLVASWLIKRNNDNQRRINKKLLCYSTARNCLYLLKDEYYETASRTTDRQFPKLVIMREKDRDQLSKRHAVFKMLFLLKNPKTTAVSSGV